MQETMSNQFEKKYEWEISSELHADINKLLTLSFNGYPSQRSFYKQQPVWRLLKFYNEDLIAHCAIESRIITDDKGKFYSIFGMADLAIHPNYQNKGLGTELFKQLLSDVKTSHFDFLVSFSGEHQFYYSHQFDYVSNECRWLLISQGKSIGLVQRVLLDCMFVLPLKKDVTWPLGKIDLLGSVF